MNCKTSAATYSVLIAHFFFVPFIFVKITVYHILSQLAIVFELRFLPRSEVLCRQVVGKCTSHSAELTDLWAA